MLRSHLRVLKSANKGYKQAALENKGEIARESMKRMEARLIITGAKLMATDILDL